MGEDIVLFHSALGVRPSVLDWAARLRLRGHNVDVPDLFEGHVFDTVEAGAGERDRIGIAGLIGRAQAAVAGRSGLVFVGFSMGTGAAELLAGTVPGARGAVLIHGALSPEDIGLTVWPAVPVQLHYAQDDPWVDVESVQALEAAARESGVRCETHVYAGGAHLFEDPGLPVHDAAAAQLMFERVAAFLESL